MAALQVATDEAVCAEGQQQRVNKTGRQLWPISRHCAAVCTHCYSMLAEVDLLFVSASSAVVEWQQRLAQAGTPA